MSTDVVVRAGARALHEKYCGNPPSCGEMDPCDASRISLADVEVVIRAALAVPQVPGLAELLDVLTGPLGRWQKDQARIAIEAMFREQTEKMDRLLSALDVIEEEIGRFYAY